MRKVAILLCILIALPFILAHGGKHNKRWNNYRRDNQQQDSNYVEPPYDCKFKGNGAFYNLEALYKNGGNAYSAVDDQGNTFYFNFCGDLSAETEATMGCDPSAAVCVKPPYYSAGGSYINAGRPSEDWEVEDDYSVSINYTNGDSCSAVDGGFYQTIIQLNCADDIEFNVTSVSYSSCQVSINAVSQYACPKMRRGHRSQGGSILVIILPALFCCCACLCLAACCRRRRRMCKRQLEMNAYQPVPQEAPQPVAQAPQVPQPIPQMQLPFAYQPYVVPMQYQLQPQQFQPQQFQPAYYFPQQPTPVAPLEQANDTHIVNRDNLVASDEQLARELQAKFDREQ